VECITEVFQLIRNSLISLFFANLQYIFFSLQEVTNIFSLASQCARYRLNKQHCNNDKFALLLKIVKTDKFDENILFGQTELQDCNWRAKYVYQWLAVNSYHTVLCYCSLTYSKMIQHDWIKMKLTFSWKKSKTKGGKRG